MIACFLFSEIYINFSIIIYFDYLAVGLLGYKCESICHPVATVRSSYDIVLQQIPIVGNDEE